MVHRAELYYSDVALDSSLSAGCIRVVPEYSQEDMEFLSRLQAGKAHSRSANTRSLAVWKYEKL